ncbi:MAG: competence/damage-inducible protein A [Clostridiales bacterium]|jgi:nicotinamide-nucleotide amidase|nr:competence/damage-inducible protein A [Clostridiales bacterium]
MNAEIIAVGTELLLGDIVNTNASFLAQKLASLGISVFFHTVVGDNAERIETAYRNAFERADMVVTTGGLGPTDDDITKEVAAKYFGRELVLHEASLKNIEDYFKAQSFTFTDQNKKQAYILEGARAVQNDNGTAPGVIYEQDGKTIIMLPGPPNENIPMFENYVAPFLAERSGAMFVSRRFRICGVGESAAENMLKDIIDAQTNPTIAPYAKTSEVHIRVTASAKDQAEAETMINPIAEKIYAILGDNVYAENDTTLEACVMQSLIDNGLTIAVAESCTGGALAARLINFPGASKAFLEGAVTYSNEAKVKRVSVKQETLDTFGAVSEQTAAEMAQGVAKASGADIGVGITGIAGPDGGSDEKPVGLVYIAIWRESAGSRVKRYTFLGDRERIRARTVVVALDLTRRFIKSS